MLTGAPDENELVTTQLKRLDTAIGAKERERARLLDAYQTGLLGLEELTHRTGILAARRAELTRRRRHSAGAAPSWPPRTVYAADSLDSATASPPHWTASTSQAAGGWYAS